MGSMSALIRARRSRTRGSQRHSIPLRLPMLVSKFLLLWGETSRHDRPLRSSWSIAGRRAFASCVSDASAPRFARPWTTRRSTKVSTGARGVRVSVSRVSFATRSTWKPFCSLASAGTILLSGPRWAMASFGSPEGHSLLVGTSGRRARRGPSPRKTSDALLRFRPVCRVLRERSALTGRALPSHSTRQVMASWSLRACTPPSSSTWPW